jgi:hypothetical protein
MAEWRPLWFCDMGSDGLLAQFHNEVTGVVALSAPSVVRPNMVRERLKGTSPATQHGVLAGGAMAFYGLN